MTTEKIALLESRQVRANQRLNNAKWRALRSKKLTPEQLFAIAYADSVRAEDLLRKEGFTVLVEPDKLTRPELKRA